LEGAQFAPYFDRPSDLDSSKLIVIFLEISFHFCEDYRIFREGEYQVKNDGYSIDKQRSANIPDVGKKQQGSIKSNDDANDERQQEKKAGEAISNSKAVEFIIVGSVNRNSAFGHNYSAFGRNLAIGHNLAIGLNLAAIGRNLAFGCIMAFGHNELIELTMAFGRELIELNLAFGHNELIELDKAFGRNKLIKLIVAFGYNELIELNMAFSRNKLIKLILAFGHNELIELILAFSHNKLIELTMTFSHNKLIKLITVFGRNKLIGLNDVCPSNLIVKYSVTHWEVKGDGKAVVKQQLFSFGLSASLTCRLICLGGFMIRGLTADIIAAMAKISRRLKHAATHGVGTAYSRATEIAPSCSLFGDTRLAGVSLLSSSSLSSWHWACKVCALPFWSGRVFHYTPTIPTYIVWWLALARKNNMVWRILSFGDSYHGDRLQYAKQICSARVPQMTKYCVMRECENI
jgi:hypothetical protein